MLLSSVVSVAEVVQLLEAVSIPDSGEEQVSLDCALARVLSRDVISGINIPGFDRSNVDGYAVRAENTWGGIQSEQNTNIELQLTGEVLHCGVVPKQEVTKGTATEIATGGMLPRGADAVIMLENIQRMKEKVRVMQVVLPSDGVTQTGNDLACGEIALFAQIQVSSRETAIMAALGLDKVWVKRKPRVAILSTGNELRSAGSSLVTGEIYDSNGPMLADAVREQGCEPVLMGIFSDDAKQLRAGLAQALAQCDLVLMSGGSSKGERDINHLIVAELKPGIFVHGVSLKPGKPLCLALSGKKLVVVLPGFSSSAAFTFHLLIATILRKMARLPSDPTEIEKDATSLSVTSPAIASNRSKRVSATLPMRVKSEKGRTEFILVYLTEFGDGWHAWPLGKGSGSVAAFSRADGFIVAKQQQQWIEAGSQVVVQLLGQIKTDLVVFGSYCPVLDKFLARFSKQIEDGRLSGWQVKYISAGSEAGLVAAQQDQCDVASCHLWHEASQSYNAPFLTPDLHLVKAYQRSQAFIFRENDTRFANKTIKQALQTAISSPDMIMANRPSGSGTSTLIKSLLKSSKPKCIVAQSHHAVVAAITQRRADWGIALENVVNVATQLPLATIPIVNEDFDLVIPKVRLKKPAVQAFIKLVSARPIGVHSQEKIT